MKCPKCRDQEMDEEIFEGITIDRCPKCKGIFLDHAELSGLLRAGQGNIADALTLSETPVIMDGIEARCDRCDQVMTSVRVQEELRIERCDKCLGLFLDEGELATLQLGSD